MAYTFANAQNTIARRDDGAMVPWENGHPADMGGQVFRRWVAEGSPVPGAYVAPPLTADETRRDAYLADAQRADIMTHLRTDNLAQIEAYVRGQVNADAVNNLATAQAAIKRIETALVILFKSLALSIRD